MHRKRNECVFVSCKNTAEIFFKYHVQKQIALIVKQKYNDICNHQTCFLPQKMFICGTSDAAGFGGRRE